MARVNNTDCHSYIKARAPFYGSNLCGALEGDTYIVYSYAEPILVYSNLTYKWFATREKFSKTTSKHVGQASRSVSPQYVQHDELLQIITLPGYIPLTEAQKMGIDDGDLCRIKHSKGVFRKGSIVRVEGINSWGIVRVTEVMAVRTKRYADTQSVFVNAAAYTTEADSEAHVRLHALEKIHDLA